MAKRTTTAKAKTKSTKRITRLYKELHPERHDITGKYIFLYMFFATCTLIFALTTIFLYSISQKMIRRYDHFIQYVQDNNVKCEEIINE